MPSPFEFVNCSINCSESIGILPPVCWLIERAIFCFCFSIRSFSRAKRNCSKSSSVGLSIGVLVGVQSTSSSAVRDIKGFISYNVEKKSILILFILNFSADRDATDLNSTDLSIFIFGSGMITSSGADELNIASLGNKYG